jgi:hypothetical protein
MAQRPTRIISHEDRKIIKTLNFYLKPYNEELRGINYAIQDVEEHFLDRIKDRDIWLLQVGLVLNFFLRNRMCQLVYNCEKSDQSLVKFGIEYDNQFIILCTCRTVRDRLKLIKFNSIIQFKENQQYEGFVMKVAKLVKK